MSTSEPQSGPLDADQLRGAALSGARRVGASRIAVEIVLFASTAIVARLVAPAELGHGVLALIVPAVAVAVIGGAVATPLVAGTDDRGRTLSRAMTRALWLGLGLTAATLAASPLVAAFASGSAAAAVKLAAIAPMVIASASVSTGLLQRDLRFGRLAIGDIALALGSASGSVTAAVLGAGGASLIIGTLCGLFAQAGVVIPAAPPLAKLRLRQRQEDRAEARDPMATEAGLAALGGIVMRQVDYAVLAARLDATSLALYWRSFQLAGEYQQKITTVFARIAFPIFARAEATVDAHGLRRELVRIHALIIFPLLATLAVTADDVIAVMFGDAWAGSVQPTRILCLVGAVGAMSAGLSPMLLAAGRTRVLVIINWVAAAAYAAAVGVAAGYGLIAATWAAAASQVMLLGVVLVAIHGPRGPLIMIADVWPALVAAGFAAPTAAIVKSLAESADAPALIRVVLAGLAAIGVAAATARFTFAPARRR